MTVNDRPEVPLTAAEPTPQLDRAARMILEICRGRTRFPQRPISGPTYFIGSGPGCDLRLGGSDFPEIHSLIQTRENGIWYEALTESPVVKINGEETQGEWLRDGDRIEIGAFQFVAHLLPTLPPVAVNEVHHTMAEVPVSDLSALDLVTCLDHEIQQVAQVQRARLAGGQALLSALRRHAQMTAAATQSFALPLPTRPAELSLRGQAEFQIDLDRLCKDLETLSSTLERRSETITAREIQFAKAAEALLESQRKLVSQLEVALEHAAELTKARETTAKPNIRVSA